METASFSDQRSEFLRVAEHIGGLDITELDLESVLKRSVERSRELVGGGAAELGLVDQRSRVVRVLWCDVPGRERQYTIPFGEGVAGRVAESGEPLVVDDYDAWPGKPPGETPDGITTVAGVPLRYKGVLIGTLSVFDNQPGRVFTGEDVHLLELLADRIAISIRNARLFQELGERIKAQRAAESRMVEAARLAAIGELAASIAHELNNPLTTINGFSELLLEEFPEGSRQRENMELVLAEARRARDVVRRLLDFSRREEHVKRPVDLTETVSEVLALTQPLAAIQRVEFQFESWDELPRVYGDRSQLRQVVQNLVTNAIQAMPDGGTLQITTGLENGAGRAVISFRDTGIGVAAAYRGRIFEPFFTTKPVGSGTGLGLSISRNIVSEHGGEIRVESEEGAGACFTVVLPIHAEGAESLEEATA
ncbi:MAG TPA: ATP-binding protein [Anaerolineales bacterium]|nr:ATP-binding protein [Anaerolineales bacterium]